MVLDEVLGPRAVDALIRLSRPARTISSDSRSVLSNSSRYGPNAASDSYAAITAGGAWACVHVEVASSAADRRELSGVLGAELGR